MKGRLMSSCLSLALLLSLALFAQEGVQPSRPNRRPDGGRPGQGQPPPPDGSFFLAQAMRAMDEKASLLLEQGKTAEAIEALREVYGLDVPKAGPFYEFKVRLIGRLAKAYAEAGKKAEALETVKKLLADLPAGTPAEAAAYLEAGGVYKKLGLFEEALKAFDRAIALSKNLAQAGGPPPLPPGAPGGPRPGMGGPPLLGEQWP